jgi:hypothetical protein
MLYNTIASSQMAKLENESVQVGESSGTLHERVSNSSRIYSTRKDCQDLKDRISAQVNDPDYWNIFASFLHGQCSKQTFDERMDVFLKTTELKLLHNELLRAIIYNAHFAMTPPLNVPIPRTEPPDHVRKVTLPTSTGTSFMTFTAADLRHLPSISQLTERIEILLTPRKIRLDSSLESQATALIFAQLKKFVLRILENCVTMLAVGPTGERGAIRITPDQILHVLRANEELVSVVSPAVLTKYSTVQV